MAKLLLFCLAWLFLSFCLFSLLWLSLLFGTQGRLRRLKFFYKHEAWHNKGLELSVSERPHRVLLGFIFVAQLLCQLLYPTLCDLRDCIRPGFSDLHCLLEFAQIHIYSVGNAIQPSHSLLPYSPFAFNFSQHQGLFQWVSSSNQVAKVLEFSISPSNEYSGLISFRIDWFDLLEVQGTLKSLLWHHSFKASILWR